MALQFVKVGQHMKARVRIILGCRIGEKAALPGDVLDVDASDAWALVSQCKAEAFEGPLPGVEDATVAPAANPVPPVPEPVAEEVEEETTTEDAPRKRTKKK